MASRPDEAVVIQPPEGTRVRKFGSTAAGHTRSRSAAGTRRGDAWSYLIEDLERDDLQVVEQFEITPVARRRGVRAPSGPTVVDVALEPGEGAVVLVERDGVFGWETGSPVETPRSRRRGRQEPVQVRFEIDTSAGEAASRRRGSRGLFGYLGGKVKGAVVGKVKAVVFKFLAGAVATAATKIIERKLKTGLISMDSNDITRWVPMSGASDQKTLRKDPARVLLWVHGTMSSTAGSYGALTGTTWGRALLADARKKYDAVLGYDHSTLARDPSENAVEIVDALKGLSNGSTLVCDGIAFSRGALVLRALIERELPMSDCKASFNKAVFVGATNAGTALAEPENWNVLLDYYTNLAVGGSRVISLVTASPLPGVLGSIVSNLGTFAKYLATTTIDDRKIPGLAAMEPDGEFVTEINRTNPGQPTVDQLRYFAVTSNFEPRGQTERSTGLPSRLLQSLADGLVDRLMGEANDLVVDTESMTTIDPGTPGYVRDVAAYRKGSGVHHLCYFSQEGTAVALGRWLGLDSGSAGNRIRSRRNRTSGVPIFPLEFGAEPEIVHQTPIDLEGELVDEEELETLHIRVIWGDLRQVDTNAYAVGHYEGVLPERAEACLDDVVTWLDWENEKPKDGPPPLGVIAKLTANRAIRGDLGRVTVLPMAEAPRIALVCGMGRAGGFDRSGLRLLHRSLSQLLVALPGERDLCTVLIGAGEGGLPIEDALRGLLLGFSDTLRARNGNGVLSEVLIAEYDLWKAHEILRALQEIRDAEEKLAKEGRRREIPLRIAIGDEKIVDHKTGGLTRHTMLSRLLSKAVIKVKAKDKSLLAEIKSLAKKDAEFKDLEAWVERAPSDPDELLGRIFVQLREKRERNESREVAMRLSFAREGGAYRVAALTSDATVPQRIIDLTENLVRDVTIRATDPPTEELRKLPAFLHRLFVPRDFRPLLARSSPLVLEVDRDTAPIPWEMLAANATDDAANAIALERQVSRQLRTSYSPAPLQPWPSAKRAKALVIGDPGDPEEGDDLPGARREAIKVAKFLAQTDRFDVLLLVGEGGARPRDRGRLKVGPSSYIDVLQLLMGGEYELVHYAGHGDFDPVDPRRAGWVFRDGFLTAREIARIDRAPRIVVANACLSAQSSGATRMKGGLDKPWGEAGLLPSLADEFYHRGVSHYIGTAWEVDDAGAIEFSREFYSRFFGGESIGAAIFAARKALAAAEHKYAGLWAAYQHYGDPTDRYRA